MTYKQAKAGQIGRAHPGMRSAKTQKRYEIRDKNEPERLLLALAKERYRLEYPDGPTGTLFQHRQIKEQIRAELALEEDSE